MHIYVDKLLVLCQVFEKIVEVYLTADFTEFHVYYLKMADIIKCIQIYTCNISTPQSRPQNCTNPEE